jgi:hypothetical protein
VGVISSSRNYLLLKFLRVPVSPRPRVSPNDKSSDEHDIRAVNKQNEILQPPQPVKPEHQLYELLSNF